MQSKHGIGEVMSNSEIIEWLKKKAETVTMPGARKMYQAAVKALEAQKYMVSRQAVIDALHTCFSDGFDGDKWWNSTHVLAAIEGLPPANNSEIPNSSDTISRAKAIEVIQNRSMMLSKEKVLLINDIEKLPPAPPERIKGHWINGHCDKCNAHAPFWAMASTYYESNFCPNCGAEMRWVTK
jgi:hypothetical protein